jgi:hypothetical protein
VDGEIVERNSGEKDHSEPQGRLTACLIHREKEWEIAGPLSALFD